MLSVGTANASIDHADYEKLSFPAVETGMRWYIIAPKGQCSNSSSQHRRIAGKVQRRKTEWFKED